MKPDPIPRFGDNRRARIGLLGGSFNPGHHGHRRIAAAALKRLGLDQIWLMVSPGNPLKDPAGMAPLPQRLASAQSLATGRRVVATAIEAKFGTRFTIDTLRRLQQAFPRAHFVWLTGADNFIQLPRWHEWRDVVGSLPIAVFPRPGANLSLCHRKAAQCFAHARKPSRAARTLALAASPAWLFLPMREDSVSSTEIRAQTPWR